MNNDRGFERFCDMSVKILNKYAPIKKKYKTENQMPFVTKGLSKAIVNRSKLINNYLKTKLMQTECYARNHCVSLLGKSKSELICKT